MRSRRLEIHCLKIVRAGSQHHVWLAFIKGDPAPVACLVCLASGGVLWLEAYQGDYIAEMVVAVDRQPEYSDGLYPAMQPAPWWKAVEYDVLHDRRYRHMGPQIQCNRAKPRDDQ